MSYNCIIGKAICKPIDGCDNIQIANICNYTIIVGRGVVDGQLLCVFEQSGQLSEEFATKHDLIKRKDENGNSVGGYFETNRRVKGLKLRGVFSEGFACPVSFLEYTGYDVFTLKEGDTFSELNGHEICRKYVTPATIRVSREKNNKQVKKKVDNIMFKKHYTTPQLRHELLSIPKGAIIYLTEKLHGCVTAKSRIRMFDGSVKSMCNIQVGDSILGMGEDGNLVESKVLECFVGGNSDHWLKIKTTNYIGNPENVIKCTPDHKFYNVGLEKYVSAKYLKVGDRVLSFKRVIKPTTTQLDIILGKMLGDGSLTKCKYGTKLDYSNREKDKGYFDFCHLVLEGVTHPNYSTRKSGYGTKMLYTATKINHYISKYFDDFKIGSKRVIPERVIDNITPLSLAIWYMDDGSRAYNTTQYQRDRVGFATCRYDTNSCKVLQSSLKKFGIDSVLYVDSKGFNRIRVNADGAEILFDLVAPYIPKCMERKLPDSYKDRLVDKPILDEEKPSIEYVALIQHITDINRLDLPAEVRYDMHTSTNNYFTNNILVHNSSSRSAHVLIDVPTSRLLKFCIKFYNKIRYSKFGYKISKRLVFINTNNYVNEFVSKFNIPTKKAWAIIHGTRNVELGTIEDCRVDGYYGTNDFRFRCIGNLKLEKNECLFGEIVGFVEKNKGIMPPQNFKDFKDKNLIKKFGEFAHFSYGCKNGESKFHVYRITFVNEDGHTVELSWPQVVARCKELGVETVPHIETFIYDGNSRDLFNKVDQIVNGGDGFPVSTIDSSTPFEGVCLRCEHESGTRIIKHKNKIFLYGENEAKDKEDYIDIEESEGEVVEESTNGVNV